MIEDRAVRVLSACAALIFATCSDGTSPADPDLTGGWAGSGGGALFELNIHDYDGRLVGSGKIQTSVVTSFISISGTRRGTAVSLTFTLSGYIPSRFVGTVVGTTRMAGHIYDSGFDGDSMVVDRTEPLSP